MSSFLLPDAAPAWQLWKSFHSFSNGSQPTTLDTPAEYREPDKSLIVGLPATACRTVGLILPEAPVDLLPDMIAAQLEKRGITIETSPQPNFVWHQLAQSAGQLYISVDILSHPFPHELVVANAANYTAALRMMQLPAGELVVLQEQDHILLALGQQGKLWHSHIIGTTATSPEDLAREINIAQLSLETLCGVPLHGVQLIGPHLGQLLSTFKPLLTLPATAASHLEPNRTAVQHQHHHLLPAAVCEIQRHAKRRRQIILGALMLAALYAVFFMLAWWNLNSIQSTRSALQAEVNATNPPALIVKSTAQRWRALEPAIDVERYPMVQLSHITTLIPPSGIQITKYNAKLDELNIEGDARDAQSATQLLEDLKKHPQLSRFNWSMPVPIVRNNIASFKIQGKLQ